MLEGLTNQAYDLSHGLWPVDHDGNGASPSLEELANRLSATSGIAIELSEQRGCEACLNSVRPVVPDRGSCYQRRAPFRNDFQYVSEGKWSKENRFVH